MLVMWQGLGQKYTGTERTRGRGSSQSSVVKRQVRQDSRWGAGTEKQMPGGKDSVGLRLRRLNTIGQRETRGVRE